MWLLSYLSNRSFQVNITNILVLLKCGLRDCGVLEGPLLFLLDVNDLKHVVD